MGRVFVLAVALVVLLAAGSLGTPPGAAAKGPSWIITGGGLGEYAYVFGGWPDGGYVPGDSARRIEAPAETPELSYIVYRSSGVWSQVADQIHGGEVLYYYPAIRALQARGQWSADQNGWFALGSDARALLDGAIDEARTLERAGQLECGAVEAQFRNILLYRATFTFGCQDAARCGSAWWHLRGAESEAFVMEHLIDVLSHPPVEGEPGQALLNSTLGVTVGDGGWGGPFVLYAPPSDGSPGRIWAEHLAADGALVYYETTAGSDRVVADLIGPLDSEARSPAAPAVAPIDAGTGRSWLVWPGIVVLGAMSVAVVATTALLRTRRRDAAAG